MKNIVFIQPPMRMEQRYGRLAAAGATAPPYGICCLAAVARKHGYRAHIIDAEASRLTVEKAAEAALSFRPHYAGFTATTLTLRNAARIARLLKEADPAVRTIVGGCHVTALPEETLETHPEFDIGVLGEGEDTLIELLRRLDEGGDPESVRGLALRRSGVVRTPRRPLIADLDSLPPPAFDLLPELARHYRPNAQSVASLPALSLMTSRGCFGQCTFCDRSVMGNKLRFHGAPFVLGMIKNLRERHGIRSISFEDDIFLALRRRLEEMASLWDRRRDTAWTCASRVDAVDEKTLRLAKRLGCWQVLYGVESGSQKILDLYDKRITLDQIERVVEMSRRLGLYTKGFLMIGNPLETLETLDATRVFAKRIALTDIALSFFTPFPGAALYRAWRKYGAFDNDPEKMTGNHVVFVPHGLSKELLQHHERKILRDFYGRVSIVWSYLRRTRDPRRLMALVPSAVGLARHVLGQRFRA
ncbi:MAG: radical SAM protein [Elusimicrobiota bacterium]